MESTALQHSFSTKVVLLLVGCVVAPRQVADTRAGHGQRARAQSKSDLARSQAGDVDELTMFERAAARESYPSY